MSAKSEGELTPARLAAAFRQLAKLCEDSKEGYEFARRVLGVESRITSDSILHILDLRLSSVKSSRRKARKHEN